MGLHKGWTRALWRGGRRALAATALLLVGIGLAACGARPATPTPSPPPPTAPRPAPTPTASFSATPRPTATQSAATPTAGATPTATSVPSATVDPLAQALATLAPLGKASPTAESTFVASTKPTPKPLEWGSPTPKPRSAASMVWLPLLFKGPMLVRAVATATGTPRAISTIAPTVEIPTGGIAVTIRGYDYSRWGRPAGMDDPSKPCGDFDDQRPVRKLTASVTVKNLSQQTMRDWSFYFRKNNGEWAYVCFQGYDRIPDIPPGRSLEITFSAWMETNETISYGVVYDEKVGLSNIVEFP